MPKGTIHFFSESVKFKVPFPRKTSSWIRVAIQTEKRKLAFLNFIFCTDDHLREINKRYLSHTTYTDIITFDHSEGAALIEGDIYISLDRVQENSLKFKTSVDNELRRVMIHGVLHLIGYRDKSSRDKSTMRKKEDAYLSLWA